MDFWSASMKTVITKHDQSINCVTRKQ